MKKVLIFSMNYYPRFIGGAEVAIKEITDRIPPTDIEFHMVTLRFDSLLPKEERIGNIVVHRIGPAVRNPSIADLKKFPLHYNKYFYQVAAADAAQRLHRIHQFDGTWAMMAHSCAIPAGIFKKRNPGVKYLLTLQEGDPPEHVERMMKPVWGLFRQGFTRADALQPISNFLAAWGRRMGYERRAKVIPNAVDTEKFAREYSAEDIATMKAKLGKRDGDVFMVTTSRLVHKNAADDVIAALAHLPENVHFLIYGIGPDEEKLRLQAKSLQLGARVRFMGQISHDEMPLMLRACDIFIRPSRSEGMGNSFVEAMAAELPVIATQEGGIADFLFDAKRNPNKETTGWAVDSDSPEQIAEAVKDILDNPEKVIAVTKHAQELARSKYDWNLIARDMRTLFDDLLESR
ncbi:MAG TPA: glycosyltransferase family 4 protein [Candidatus Paceibacterota bacterium]|nr:glycosyltransferase family 4 protein [Candidatus Paceibacterota bacterium]